MRLFEQPRMPEHTEYAESTVSVIYEMAAGMGVQLSIVEAL